MTHQFCQISAQHLCDSADSLHNAVLASCIHTLICGRARRCLAFAHTPSLQYNPNQVSSELILEEVTNIFTSSFREQMFSLASSCEIKPSKAKARTAQKGYAFAKKNTHTFKSCNSTASPEIKQNRPMMLKMEPIFQHVKTVIEMNF